ncbi:universal stress protein [Aequorivita sp. F47161]|uniref:Universal stress protein n=1 Tax=Aequorivita vitellina TaxID=2874475 RepID=A0A9X1QTF3_9FLAO|nr:universal stress protein [Aequorivita vitellina]MCG2419126.1 universal stress protein [Aequorivita vitellina]
MKNILLPTDFSENSKNAIKYALKFFEGETCTFHILNTQKPSGYITAEVLSSEPGSSVYEGILRENKEKLKKMVTFCESFSEKENFTFVPKIDFDDIVAAVNQIVVQHKIDLIVMGTNGATGAKEIIFGSNTLKIIRNVYCPLIVIPEGYSFEKIDSVLLSLNYQNDVLKKTFEVVLAIVKKHKAAVKILDIVEEDVEVSPQQNHIKEVFKDVTCEDFKLMNIPIPLAVSAFVQLIPVQLHATVARRKSFIDRFIFGSDTSAINYSSRIPLLVLHE